MASTAAADYVGQLLLVLRVETVALSNRAKGRSCIRVPKRVAIEAAFGARKRKAAVEVIGGPRHSEYREGRCSEQPSGSSHFQIRR